LKGGGKGIIEDPYKLNTKKKGLFNRGKKTFRSGKKEKKDRPVRQMQEIRWDCELQKKGIIDSCPQQTEKRENKKTIS